MENTVALRRRSVVDLLDVHYEAITRLKRATLGLILAARAAGMTNQEIGGHLGMTEGGVRMFVGRASRVA